VTHHTSTREEIIKNVPQPALMEIFFGTVLFSAKMIK